MLKYLTVKPLMIACGALLLALAVLTPLYIGRGTTIDALQATVDTQASALKTAADTIRGAEAVNDAAMDVIEDLKQRLTAAIGENQAVAEANARARTALATAQRDRDRTAAELKRLKESLYATDETAAAWSRAAVPAGIGDRLRQRWDAARGDHEAGSGGGSGAPAGRLGPGAAGSEAAAAAAEPRAPGFRGLSDRLPVQ